MGTKGTTYLGIDGGGTRCRAQIEDENGRVLGAASAGPATTRIGFENAWRSIMEATEAAAAQAGLTREDFARMHAGIGLAGLGRRGAEAALNKIAHPFASVIFISDGLAACLGAHSGADGAIVVAGTGSVGVGLIDGREIRLAGYGFPVSDEGSGADIGLQVVRLALRAADRRSELTPLLSEVLGAFDHDPYQAVAWSEEARATDYAAFAPIGHAYLGFRMNALARPVEGRSFQMKAENAGNLQASLGDCRQSLDDLAAIGDEGRQAARGPLLAVRLNDASNASLRWLVVE